ncbi:polysaccharide pyruvyl transferase CsaB [Halobacillus sp. SY10]|uniref:polysaccharide pyruvyl transferase CsaB n=1 Tax=Halobacillus sp. SY10 TaxID=3381356 RepID=UPI00387A76C8
MHVVLSGYFGFHNAGDEAILASMIKQLRNADPEIRITVLTNDEIHTTATYGVESVNRWKINDVVRILKKADGLISGGGSLLQNATGPRSIIYYTAIMNMARFLRKPVYIYAQGMGPFRQSLLKKLVTYTLNRVSKITVRDKDSMDLLRTIGVKKEISLVPDPVLGLERSEEPSSWIEENQVKSPIISISARDWTGKEKFIPKLAQAADQLTEEGYSIVFVPMHGASDYEFSKEITANMKHRAYVSPADSSIEEKMAIITASELLIGMRLHALIFSAVCETPFVPISYDPKIDSLAQIYNRPVDFHIEDENWEWKKLHEVSIKTLSNQQVHRDELRDVNRIAKSETTGTVADIIQTFKKTIKN